MHFKTNYNFLHVLFKFILEDVFINLTFKSSSQFNNCTLIWHAIIIKNMYKIIYNYYIIIILLQYTFFIVPLDSTIVISIQHYKKKPAKLITNFLKICFKQSSFAAKDKKLRWQSNFLLELFLCAKLVLLDMLDIVGQFSKFVELYFRQNYDLNFCTANSTLAMQLFI